MHDLLDRVIEEMRGAWRFRWIAMVLAWAVSVVGWLVVFAMPNMYEATAKVYVDTRTILKPLLNNLTIETDVDSQLRLVRQAMLGRPQLERVARETELDLRVRTPASQAAMIDRLRNRITIQGGSTGEREGSSGGLYVISYQDPNRDKSIQVVEKLLNSFVEDTLGGNREGTETAQRFLMKQIEEYEAKLSEAENRLAEFKKKNVGLMPGEQTGDYFSRLQNELDAVKKAESSLGVALSRREELQRQLRGEMPFVASGSQSSGAGGVTATDTATRIQETQARLDDLLLRFTDKHPDVLAARATLEQLKQRRDTELAALRRGDPGALANAGAASNPVYQSIQLALNQTEVEIASLRGEIGEHNRKVAELRGLVDTVPRVEAEYARLNRDYEVVRQGYRELVDRLQKARLSERADETGVVKFEVVDPPAAGFAPVAPNRLLLLAVVLLAGLAMGGGLAWLLHQLRPVFNNTRTLAEITGLPVLGSISMTWMDRRRVESRLRKLAWSSAAAALLLVYGMVVLFQSSGTRFVQKIFTWGPT